MQRSPLIALFAFVSLALAGAAPSMSSAVTGSWTGTYDLRGQDSVAFVVSGRRATVALGPSHASAQTVAFSQRKGHVRFQLAGRPSPVVFEGQLRNGRIVGTARQGTLR